MSDAAYYRAWRAAHPEYRQRESARRQERKRLNGRGDRSAEYAKRPSRAAPPMPPMHSGHPLYDEAVAIVGPRVTALHTLTDPLYDDLIAEATLAILEGRDPREAVRAYGARERSYGRVTAPLFEEAA